MRKALSDFWLFIWPWHYRKEIPEDTDEVGPWQNIRVERGWYWLGRLRWVHVSHDRRIRYLGQESTFGTIPTPAPWRNKIPRVPRPPARTPETEEEEWT